MPQQPGLLRCSASRKQQRCCRASPVMTAWEAMPQGQMFPPAQAQRQPLQLRPPDRLAAALVHSPGLEVKLD